MSQHLTHLGLLLCLQEEQLCCPAHAAGWHFSVVGWPVLTFLTSPSLAAQKISWPSTRQCWLCLGEDSLGRAGQNAFV